MCHTSTVSALFTIPCVALLPVDALAHTLMNVKWRHHRLKGLGVTVCHQQIFRPRVHLPVVLGCFENFLMTLPPLDHWNLEYLEVDPKQHWA